MSEWGAAVGLTAWGTRDGHQAARGRKDDRERRSPSQWVVGMVCQSGITRETEPIGDRPICD